MKRLMIVVALLCGCTQQPSTHPTNYRQTATACEPSASYAAKLRAAIKSRDEWKRYAEKLETFANSQK